MTIEKLNMKTSSLADERYAALTKLFPNAVTETIDENGSIFRAIDKDVLMQEINIHVVEGPEERYQFTWPDKRKSMTLANDPINAALRPCREESVDFDATENLYIEGDNLDVLKLLRETYLSRVKMIYIDPPYNTGNDFVFEDNFAEDAGSFLDRDGRYDEQGNRLAKNLDSNGRFHTDWLNMLYPRLRIAKDLLTDDGVIFISIDDHEQHNMKNICNEIFGESNFIAQVVWERAYAPINLMKHFSRSHDYILVYSKNIDLANNRGIARSEEADNRYINPDNDPRGIWKPSDLSVGPAVPANIYTIQTPSGRLVEPPAGRSWRLSEKAFHERLRDNRIWFGQDGNSVPSIKRFLSELRKTGITPMTVWKYEDVGHSQSASNALKELFDDKMVFDYPKPVDLIKRCLQLYTHDDDIVLDFFAGSSTTAHAVMEQNADDGGNRKFILVQINEEINHKNIPYESIPEVGMERIRRAGTKIKEENPLGTIDLDVGFRVLKLDSSNMKDVYYTPDDLLQSAELQQDLFGLVDNIKEDRSGEDLLFQVMLDLGIPLSAKIHKKDDVFYVQDNYLIACFKPMDTEMMTEIAKLEPHFVVFRDSSFDSDSTMVNFEQVFNTYSPNTTKRIL